MANNTQEPDFRNYTAGHDLYDAATISNTISFKNSGPLGDTVAFMAAIKHRCEQTGSKAIIYQHLDILANYEGYVPIHPTQNADGAPVMMNADGWEKLKPLLLAQPYIAACELWTGQPVDYDMDVMRSRVFANLPNGPMQHWPGMVYPELYCSDLSQPWLTVPDRPDLHRAFSGKLLINRSLRYHNQSITYYFLKAYEKDLYFIGHEDEYKTFCTQWKLEFPRIGLTDFLELAQIMKASRGFLGNQSFTWNLANSLGVPRILERCSWVNNCFGLGAGAKDFLHNEGLEYFVKQMMDGKG